MAAGLCTNAAGAGQFHIMTPMLKYISTARKITDAISLLLSAGVSLSVSMSSAEADNPLFTSPAEVFPKLLPFNDAPYPALSTACIISSSAAFPSTPIELVRRFTEHAVTPGTFETSFSTRALQAAQLIPVTEYCFIFYSSAPVLSAVIN